MRRFAALWVIIFAGLAWGGPQANVAEVKGERVSADYSGEGIWVAPGASAVILRKLGTHEAIIAKAVVRSYEAGRVYLESDAFNALAQDALPTYQTAVHPGDTIALGWMFNRRLIIAPSLGEYSSVQALRSETSIVNSDLFAAFLSKRGHPSPLKEDFSDFCDTFDVGVVELVVATRLYTVDCHTFNILQKAEIANTSTNPETPFYSRVKEIDASWFGEGSDRISDYTTYYTTLLGEK